MPETPENTEQQNDPFKGTKFEGKSAEDILKSYGELESTLGRQGQELGQLRSTVQTLQSSREEREPADKRECTNRHTRYADDLIINPEETLPKLVEEIKREVVADSVRASQAASSSERQVEGFFRSNPDLEGYREIVSVIGERIYQSNPSLPLSQVLEETGKQARTYIADLEKRITGRKKEDAERKRAGITTSGGMTRESMAVDEREPEDRIDPEQAAILNEIKRIKDNRAKKVLAPRSR